MNILTGLFFVPVGSFSMSISVAQSNNNQASALNKRLEAELLETGADDQKCGSIRALAVLPGKDRVVIASDW